MSSRDLLKTSILIQSALKLLRGYYFIAQRFYMVYKDSHTYRCLSIFWKGTKLNFRYSFLGRLSEADNIYKPQFFYNSVLIRWLPCIYRDLRDKIRSYIIYSTSVDTARQAKKEIFFQPVKIGSMVIITVILTNIILSLVFHKEIGLSGWAVRILFLSIALEGLFCNASWQDLKETSFTLKRINNYCKA